jgi:hypothetical protein
MPTWNTLLDLTDLYADLAAGRKTITEFSKAIAKRLDQNPYASQLSNTIQMFRDATNTREVDVALQELWDFADVDRRIFVKVEEEHNHSFLN